MKKLLTLFCLMMLSLTISFSQTTLTPSDSCVLISSEQLKTANLIFNQHAELEYEIGLLEQKLFNYEQMFDNWNIIDSVRVSQIEVLDMVIEDDRQVNAQLQTALKRQQYVTGGSILVTIILAVLCVIK